MATFNSLLRKNGQPRGKFRRLLERLAKRPMDRAEQDKMLTPLDFSTKETDLLWMLVKEFRYPPVANFIDDNDALVMRWHITKFGLELLAR